jgi:hypothetical protein
MNFATGVILELVLFNQPGRESITIIVIGLAGIHLPVQAVSMKAFSFLTIMVFHNPTVGQLWDHPICSGISEIIFQGNGTFRALPIMLTPVQVVIIPTGLRETLILLLEGQMEVGT